MKKYDLIYVNGDSYSAPNTAPVYSDRLTESLDLPSINRAKSGSNNYRIARTTINDLLCHQGQNILCILGWSFVTRDEIWYEGNDPSVLARVPDPEYPSHLITADWVLSEMKSTESQDILIDLNINRQLSHFYVMVFGMAMTLENLGIDYVMFSAADNTGWRNQKVRFFDQWPVYQHISANPKIIDLHGFNIPGWARDNGLNTNSTGHLFEDGHRMFAGFMQDTIEQLYT